MVIDDYFAANYPNNPNKECKMWMPRHFFDK